MKNYGGYFDVDSKLSEISSLEEKVNSSDFWNDVSSAQKVIDELNGKKKSISLIVSLKDDICSYIDFIDMISTLYDEDIYKDICSFVEKLPSLVSKIEFEVLFSGEYDHSNCIVEIHAGAGGTEACDWCNMLYRMYTRYCSSKGYKVEVIDLLDGDEAGIKRVSFLVTGFNAYGYLKCEKGVHRLVRLSPFDSNNKRHTSFASVDVIPEIDSSIDIEIRDEDLKIDVYRSSGAGGQSVNTTDSAVRITHLPTKIVVSCQNERSQLKNKEKAMQILKSKLLLMEMEEKEKERLALKGEVKNIEFGSQIRSYVMHPYSMVKDHRTNIETSNVNGVLDGNLDLFIEGYLRS